MKLGVKNWTFGKEFTTQKRIKIKIRLHMIMVNKLPQIFLKIKIRTSKISIEVKYLVIDNSKL